MSEQTPHEQQELLRLQNLSNDEQTKGSSLVKHEQLENTPFHLVIQEGKWFITFKNYRISDIMTFEETEDIIHDILQHKFKALDYLEKHMWQIIMYVSGVIHESIAKDAIATMQQEQDTENHDTE
jgi:predicted DNA-binding protein (MmcQ/YjbR family)